VRVVVAEDSGLVRQGLVRLLTDEGIHVVAEVDNPTDLVRHVELDRPDAALIDIRMPPTHTNEGIVAAEHIREHAPETGVLVLSQHIDAHFALRLLGADEGGVGYLLKDRVLDAGELLNALNRVAAGEAVIDTELVNDLIAQRGTAGTLGSLTETELRVLTLMAEGLSDRGIAERLYVSARTVETHVRHVLTKLDLPVNAGDNRRILAVLTYLRA
jgi:DNA-binding NarL/FixJ family response regulator